jgi:hypothetical protein
MDQYRCNLQSHSDNGRILSYIDVNHDNEYGIFCNEWSFPHQRLVRYYQQSTCIANIVLYNLGTLYGVELACGLCSLARWTRVAALNHQVEPPHRNYPWSAEQITGNYDAVVPPGDHNRVQAHLHPYSNMSKYRSSDWLSCINMIKMLNNLF